MPRPSKGPRLYYDDDRASWCIRDGSTKRRLGLPRGDQEAAEQRLAAYIAEKYRPPAERDPARLTIADVLSHYAATSAGRHADPAGTSYHLARLTEWWGEKTISEINRVSCLEYGAHRAASRNRRATKTETPKPISVETIRRELSVLSAAISVWHSDFPLTTLPVVTLPEKPVGRTRWLRREEVAAMLRACRNHTDKDAGRALARFILLALYTGSRSKAVRQLGWLPSTVGGWVDVDAGLIYRRGEGERETSKRRPPLRLPDRLRPLLEAWRAADLRIPDDAGEDWQPPTRIVHYKGFPVEKQRRAWAYVLEKAGLGEDVVNHTLRHTAATWMMQQGINPYDAAAYLGMSYETLMRTYGHHHPDFQRDTAAAIGRRRRP